MRTFVGLYMTTMRECTNANHVCIIKWPWVSAHALKCIHIYSIQHSRSWMWTPLDIQYCFLFNFISRSRIENAQSRKKTNSDNTKTSLWLQKKDKNLYAAVFLEVVGNTEMASHRCRRTLPKFGEFNGNATPLDTYNLNSAPIPDMVFPF